MENCQVIIVGSGPAGSATALALAGCAPELIPYIRVLEKETHPRPKPCGGGMTFTGERVLNALGVTWQQLALPHVPIHCMRALHKSRPIDIDVPYIFRVVRRERLDAALVQQVRARGIEVREATPVTRLRREGGMWEVSTPSGTLRTPVVVGADGSRGIVRREAGLQPGEARVARLLEILTPPSDPLAQDALRDHMAIFDFSVMAQGVQGYYWDFPSVIDGEPVMNRGIFDSRVIGHRPRADLKAVLRAALGARGLRLEDYRLIGHPERWYDPGGIYSRPGVVLVGDAAGVEPQLGEGISYALWYGLTVAPWIADAVRREDFAFGDYSRRLRSSALGRNLAFRVWLARMGYSRGERSWHWGWSWLRRWLDVMGVWLRRDMARNQLGQPGPQAWPAR